MKLGMQSDLHRNVVYQSVELLLLVSMLFLPAIPKSLLILKEFLYTIIIIVPLYKWMSVYSYTI